MPVLLLAGCGGGERTVTVTETVTVEADAPDAAPAEPEESDAATEDAETAAEVGDEQTYSNVDQIEIDGKPVDVTLEVRVADLRAKIDSPQYLDPQAGNRYVRMSIVIRNVGNDAYTPSAEFQFVTRTGQSGNFQSLGQPGDLGPAAVRPGREVRGFLWAEVPKQAVVDQIIFAPFGGDPATDLVWDVDVR